MTHIKLSVEYVYLGWEDVSLSDDLTLLLETESTEHEMSSSLQDLFRLYYYVSEEKECDLSIGTGQSIHIENNDDHIRLRKAPLCIITTFRNVREELESVLADIFTEKNRMNDRSARVEKLDYLEEYLAEQGENIDVWKLYERLTAD